ncbi:MAG: hypothetical protein QOC61_131 [Acidobacteriota bacterium]|jgi:hypothetical protein|nr:hypothetical protein [Acidobacteriota bacterium]MDT5261127.1 hypothetical protein [Acidobacteriota bacterium]
MPTRKTATTKATKATKATKGTKPTKATSASKATTATKAPARQASAGGPLKLPVKRFRVLLESREGSEVSGFTVPFDVEKTFGTRARVPVRGTVNGFPFRGSLFPMGGCHMMVVNRHLRAGARVKGGDTATVVMERDTEPRVIEAPADFARALKANKDAQALWDKLSFTHRREHVEHIEDAKRPETRQRRIEKSIQLLAAGKREPRG